MNQTQAPIVSVIIPCYNHAELIRETVRSIARQTFTDWECIIVNDGSTDSSEEVCLQLAAEDPRIRYISQPNGGPAGARNRGLQEVRGRYVQFMDADDTIEDGKIELQVRELSTTNELALAYCDFEWCNEAGETVEVDFAWRVEIDERNPLLDVTLNWQHEIVIPPCCFLFDARFFTEHGIREDEAIRANEDYDLLVRVFALRPQVFFHRAKLARYRVLPGSVCHNIPRIRSTYFHILEALRELFADDPEMLAILRRKERIVRWDWMQVAPIYSIDWWVWRVRRLARLLLPGRAERRAQGKLPPSN